MTVTATPAPPPDALRAVWLIERGQPEGLARPEWWGVTDSRTGAYGWVDSAFSADQFVARAEAEKVIARFSLPGHPFQARAVEHGFLADLIAATPAPLALDLERLAHEIGNEVGAEVRDGDMSGGPLDWEQVGNVAYEVARTRLRALAPQAPEGERL